MLDVHSFALFFLAALLLAPTPGSGMFYVAARTLSGGHAEEVASSFGNGLGGLVHIATGAVGVLPRSAIGYACRAIRTSGAPACW